jgi:hypothetical protein
MSPPLGRIFVDSLGYESYPVYNNRERFKRAVVSASAAYLGKRSRDFYESVGTGVKRSIDEVGNVIDSASKRVKDWNIANYPGAAIDRATGGDRHWTEFNQGRKFNSSYKMARRRSYKRKRYSKSRYSRKARRSGIVTARRIPRGVHHEMKYADVGTNTNTSVIDALTIYGDGLLNTPISQGLTGSTRIGRQITLRSFHLKGQITFIPIASDPACINFVMYVVQDNQCCGASATVGDIFANPTTPCQAFINLENSQRFKILRKITCTMVPQAGIVGAMGTVTCAFDVYKRVNIRICYDTGSTTGNVADMKNKNVFLALGHQGLANAGTVQVKWANRWRFTD